MSPRELIYAKLKEAREAYRAGFASEPQKIMATLRDYQLNSLFATSEALERGERYFMVVSAVGTGKSRIAVALVFCLNGFLITPSIEIMRGMLADLGVDCSNMSSAKVAKAALEFRITTPVRLANRLSKGDDPICDDPPKLLVVDEAHGHVESNTIAGALRAMLPGACLVGLTATPYRGSAAGSKELKELWGEPYVALSMAEAVHRGMILAPECIYNPLVCTDALTIEAGEFKPSDVEEAYAPKIERLADIVQEAQKRHGPTVVSVTTTATAQSLEFALRSRGCQADAILQGTSGKDRSVIFSRCAANKTVMIQIRCLSQGVNIPPLSCYVDAQPTLSTTLFCQTIGRILRVDKNNPAKKATYICTNDNLATHGRIFVGMPSYRDVVEVVKKNPPSPRMFLRRLVAASESELARATVIQVKNVDGENVVFLNLSAPVSEGSPIWNEHLIARTPNGRVFHAERSTGGTIAWEDEEAQYKETPMPRSLSGLKTQRKRSGKDVTEKQARFWSSCARSVGLEPDVDFENFDPRAISLMAAARKLRWRLCR